MATIAAPAPSSPPDLPSSHDVRELRLALVCYGGVSLAIYMHGITKELEKLARASAQLIDGDDANPFPADRTERAYFDALQRKAADDGFHTRVVIDIISGTSAGGINGVCLAKALALDAPQDGLRDLWLTKGAILKLLARWPKLPPLAGNRMLKWLGGAFSEMDGHGKGTLMPPGLALNLFVTTTDINGYNRQIPIADPPAINTVVNKHVFEFRDRDGVGNLDSTHNPALAFAARATSCFPGAFPATALADIQHEEARLRFPAEFCRAYELAGSPVDLTFFVDGGVLDNFPFKHAVRAVAGKPAATQVDRRLLFIEPDPARPGSPPDGATPGFAATIWAGLSKLPRRQPIGDALDELTAYNQRVRRVKQMIGAVEDDVLITVVPLLRLDYAAANKAANSGAIGASPYGFQAYLRLKLLAVVEGIATSVCGVANYPPQTTHALFVRRALLAWAEAAGLLKTAGDPTDEQRQFLRTFDLGYGHRRLAFVIGRVNHFYGSYDREPLNVLKHRLYELIAELGGVLERPDASFLRPAVERIFGEERIGPYLEGWRVAPFLESARGEIDELRSSLGTYIDAALEGFGERAYSELDALTSTLTAEMRDDIRAHYLGFPYWDSTTYPARALSDVAELDEVQVVRVSPLDTHRLSPPAANGGPPTAASKLHGVALGHFGAFFRRSWRENDYLWGRLDGAERLLWLIGDTTDESAKAAFAAIVAEEGPKLRKAAGLVRRVQQYAADGAAGEAAAGRPGASPARSPG
jgi:patatin-related protein